MYSTIIHATDLSTNHFKMCQQAVDIAKCFGATLYLLHVIESPTSLQIAQGLGFAELMSPVKDTAQAVMKVLGEALNIPADKQMVEVGSIKLVLFEKVKTLHCDLIILGSHTPTHLPPFLGSTAHTITQHAPCDVLTIRAS